MSEEITVEYQGAGFVHPWPGEFANCQVVFDSDTKQVLRVEPLGTVATTSAQPEVQSAEQANSGG